MNSSKSLSTLFLMTFLLFFGCGKPFSKTYEQWPSNGKNSFVKGVDISCLFDIEENGGVYRDKNGFPRDMLEILSENGVNWIRARVWNAPDACINPHTYNYGMCTIEKAAAVGGRAKALGMKILLDFHYSDTWADPRFQRIPRDWENFRTFDALQGAVYEFTRSSIQKMIEAGARPDMVQIGNEIDQGLLLQKSDGEEKANFSCEISGENFTRILNCASRAVREADRASPISVMLHFSHGGDWKRIEYYIERSADVDYDVVGLSYYPFYKSHGALSGLGEVVHRITHRLSKECIVVETSFPFIMEQGEKFDCVQNVLWYKNDDNTTGLTAAYENLSEVSLRYGISTGSYIEDGKIWRIVEATEENQKAVISAISDTIRKNGGAGVFYWGGEWISADPLNAKRASSWENQALFDLDGKGLPALGF